MKNSLKIEWLLTSQFITTYQISKATGESTQFLDRYKKDPSLIGGMRLDKAENLLEYISNLTKDDVFPEKWTNQQILVQNITKDELEDLFDCMKMSSKLNWIKEHKDMYIVNFDTVSDKKFHKWPYEIENLIYIFKKCEVKLRKRFMNYMRACGIKHYFGGSRVLYEVDGKKYQLITRINKPSVGKAVDFLGFVETDVYRDDLAYKISEENSHLAQDDL